VELLIIALLLLGNGVFAMYEIAFVSASKATLETLSQKGNKIAKQVLRLLQEPERILSTIQVGITLVGIVSGAFGGVALADDLVPYLKEIEIVAPYARDVAFIIIVGGITYFSLIFGELVPKSIALSKPEEIVLVLTPIMYFISIVLFPFVWFLSLSTHTVNKVLGIKEDKEKLLTQEELKFYLRKGWEQGVLNKEESRMITEVFRFTNKKVYEIMTHRKEVVCLTKNSSKEEVLAVIKENQFSKYVLCGDTWDEVFGIVSTKQLVNHIDDDDFDLLKATEPALFIPENLTVNKVLEIFRERKKNFGVVVNEYGSLEGIITLHDLTETVLGDFPEETEELSKYLVRQNDGSYMVEGSMQIDHFMDELGILTYDEIENIDFSTLGGLAMHFLNKVPAVGDRFYFRDLQFDVMEMDGSRVDKLMVKQLDKE
jgi:putative hemolysin